MKKVLYVIDTLQIGGAERSILELTSNLTHFQPVVCHIYRNDFLKKDFEARGVKVVSLDVPGTYNFRTAGRKLYALLKEEKPDLVVATLLRSELIARTVCFLSGVPVIGTFVNNGYGSEAWESIGRVMKFKKSIFRMLNIATARVCAGFLANSKSISENNSKALLIQSEKVKVIYRGRPADQFPFHSHTFKPVAVKLLSVGRLLPGKGFQEIIHAVSRMHHDFPDMTLTIAGEGPYRKPLEALIGQLGLEKNVILAGNVKDVASLMRAHDLFVFASHNEGFSGTILEAMFTGIPIIASDIAMNKEAVEHAKTARLFSVKNVDAMEAELRWALSNPDQCIDMAKMARDTAMQRFEIRIIASQHESYYELIVNR